MNEHVYVFTGRVLPERTHVTIGNGNPIVYTVRRDDWGLDCTVAISVAAAQVSALVESSNPIDDLATLKNVIADIVGTVIDAYGYREGRGYLVELTSLTLQDGHLEVYGVEIGALQASRDERPLELHPLLFNVLSDGAGDTPGIAYHRQSLRYALADLRQAILSPPDTLFHCYRAIESVMQGFREPQGQGDDKAAWESMRRALVVDEAALKKLGTDASRHRHGAHATTTGAEREAAMLFAWRIVDRVTLFVQRGGEPLGAEDFSFLAE